jgi:hypothetical protein
MKLTLEQKIFLRDHMDLICPLLFTPGERHRFAYVRLAAAFRRPA